MRGAGAFVQTIQIDVIEPQTPLIRIDEGERRTGHVFFSNSQRGADTLHIERLSGAEWTTEQKDLATLEPCAELMPVVERLFGT